MASANALTALVELNFNTFLLWMSTLGVILLIWCIQIYMQTRTLHEAVQAMNISIREDITSHISNYSYDDFERNSEGTYVSWLTNDITTINEYGFGTLTVILSQLFTILFSVTAIFHFHYSIIVTVSGLVIVVLGTPKIFSKKLNIAMNKVTEENEKLTTQIGDVMNGYSSLFMMNLREFIVYKIREGSLSFAEKKVSYAKLSGLMSASTNGASLLSQIIVIVQTGYLYAINLVPVGAMSGTQYFAANIFASLTGLSANLIEMKTVNSIFNKFEKMKVSENNKIKIDVFSNYLMFQDVTFQYENTDQPIINNKSLVINKGGKYALIGQSGTGKSTILNLISGKIQKYMGHIEIDGHDYKNLDLNSVRGQIIYLEQSPHIFNISIRENIDLKQDATKTELQNAIKRAGLESFIASLPNGLDTIIHTNGKNLSGGQRQRIALARGFITGKSIVLFDEATSSLDKVSAKKIEDDIVKQADLTVIMVTHHLREDLKEKLTDIIYM